MLEIINTDMFSLCSSLYQKKYLETRQIGYHTLMLQPTPLSEES